MSRCEDVLDIDTVGAQILERCELSEGHFGDHENKKANYGRGYSWQNTPAAYDPFRDVPENG